MQKQKSINTVARWLLAAALLVGSIWIYGQPGGPHILFKGAGYVGTFFIVLIVLILL